MLDKYRKKGQQKSKEVCGKKVSSYTKNGKKVATYNSVRDAGRSLDNIELAKNITQCCRDQRRRLVHGLQWRYGEEPFIEPVREDKKGKYPKISLRKPVYQIDINTNDILNVYNSITEASDVTGVNSTGISSAANGKQKTSGGYKWRFVSEY